MNKTDKALTAFKAGRLKEALGIFAKFHGFSKEEKRSIQIAYECMTGKESFYSSLGYNISGIRKDAILAISSKYGVSPTLHI